MAYIGLISNGHSGGNISGRISTRFLEGLVFHAGGLARSSKDHEEGLDKITSEFISSGIEVVAINGGDGTFQKLLTSYIKNSNGRDLPKFLILRSGSMNILADAFKLGDNPNLSLFKLIDNRPTREVSLRTLEVNSNGIINYGSLFASGAVYNFVADHNDTSTGEKTIVKAGKMFARALWSDKYADQLLRPTEARLYVEERFRGDRHSAILVAGYKINVFGIKPFNFMPQIDGGFYEGDNNFSKSDYLINLMRFRRGEEVKACNYAFGINHVRMVADKPFGYTLDGELFTTNEVVIKDGPVIKLLQVS